MKNAVSKALLCLLCFAAGCGAPPTWSPSPASPAPQERFDPALAAELDAWLATYQGHPIWPGLVALAIDPDGRWWWGTVGALDLDTATPIASDSRFPVMWATGQVLGSIALTLVDEGLLDVDDSLYAVAGDVHPRAHEIRIVDLLLERSGLPAWEDGPYRADPARAWTEDELISALRTEPLRFDPGAAWDRSSGNDLMLGAVIESVSGRPWREDLEERLRQPLGLASWQLAPPTGPGVVHVPQRPWPDPWYPPGGDGSVGLLTSLEDYARWFRARFDGQLLGPEVEALQTDRGQWLDEAQTVGVGLAMFNIPDVYGDALTTSIWWEQSLSATVYHRPESGWTTALLANGETRSFGSFPRGPEELHDELWELLLGPVEAVR